MAGTPFTESGLQFTFPDNWVIIKYDEHRFYRYLSGSGLKGVDFIAIHNDALILIEVKNYTDRVVLDNYSPMEVLIDNPDLYVEAYFRKFQDTFRLLDIIDQYYHRKWWFKKLFLPFKSWLSEKYLMKKEIGFWSKAIEILKKNNEVKLMLWLELAPDFDAQKAQSLIDYFDKEVNSKIAKGTQFIIANTQTPYGGIIAKNKL